jgi:hypothetical protein
MSSGGGMGSAVAPPTIINVLPSPELIIPSTTDGRLSVASGVPVSPTNFPTLNNLSQTLYYTPYKGNHVSLYTGGVWKDYQTDEISISAKIMVPTSVNDIFLQDDGAGRVRMTFVKWTNETTRAVPLDRQDGTPVLSTDHSQKFVGTIFVQPINPGSTDPNLNYFFDEDIARCVSNFYNAVPLSLYNPIGLVDDNTPTSHAFTGLTATFSVPEVASEEPLYVNFVCCEPREVKLGLKVKISSANVPYGFGLGISPTDFSGEISQILSMSQTSLASLSDSVETSRVWPAGVYYAYSAFFVTGGDGTMTLYSDDGRRGAAVDVPLSYMHGFILG